MSKKMLLIVPVVLVALLAAPVALAQDAPADVVQSYYTALEEAAAGGDTDALLNLFADDATVTVEALSPQPVQGKEAIQSVFGGMMAMMQGLAVTMGDVSVDGDTVTVSYTLNVASTEGGIPATDTFVIQDGKIQSLTIDIAAGALAGAGAAAAPGALPTSGGPAVFFPALLIAGGTALAALSRRISRRCTAA
jgi:ketosteroid isomerase-like protein